MKKAGISPSLCRNDRLMQDSLGPADGMHTGMKPDPGGWGYPSEGRRLHLNNIKAPHRSVCGSMSNECICSDGFRPSHSFDRVAGKRARGVCE